MAVSVTAGTSTDISARTTVPLSIAVTAGDKVIILCSGTDYAGGNFSVSATGYTADLSASAAHLSIIVLRKDIVSTGTESLSVAIAGTDTFGWLQPIAITGAATGAGTNASASTSTSGTSPDYPSTGVLPSASGVVFALLTMSGENSTNGIDLPAGYTQDFLDQTNNQSPTLYSHKITSATTAEDPPGGTLSSSVSAWRTGIIFYAAAAAGSSGTPYYYHRRRR